MEETDTVAEVGLSAETGKWRMHRAAFRNI